MYALHAKIEWDFFMMQIPLSNSQAFSGNEKEEYDRLCKIILLGAEASGKTSILERYVKNSFSDSDHATVSSLYSSYYIAYLHVQCMCY